MPRFTECNASLFSASFWGLQVSSACVARFTIYKSTSRDHNTAWHRWRKSFHEYIGVYGALGHVSPRLPATVWFFTSLQSRRTNSEIRLHVHGCLSRKNIHAYSFETVYCMNFIIFLCLILKLFSASFVRLLVPTSDLSFNCFRQQLKTFLFCKYWHQSQYYFSALETSFMRSTNLWYLLTYLHKHDTSLSGGTQSQTTQIGTTQVRASPRSACQIQRQTDSHDVSDDDDDTDNSL